MEHCTPSGIVPWNCQWICKSHHTKRDRWYALKAILPTLNIPNKVNRITTSPSVAFHATENTMMLFQWMICPSFSHFYSADPRLHSPFSPSMHLLPVKISHHVNQPMQEQNSIISTSRCWASWSKMHSLPQILFPNDWYHQLLHWASLTHTKNPKKLSVTASNKLMTNFKVLSFYFIMREIWSFHRLIFAYDFLTDTAHLQSRGQLVSGSGGWSTQYLVYCRT